MTPFAKDAIATRHDGTQKIFVPDDIVTQKCAYLGRTGSGKSYAATRMAELLAGWRKQFIALDPVGIWWGLRLDAAGKRKGLEIPVFGGLHGDIPLEPTAGAVVADLVVDRRLTVILDVSQFESDAAKARFSADFGDRFFRRMKAAPAQVHLFLEECQEFVPQNIQKGEERMLHVWTRMWKLGRNFGIGGSLISQRPQEVSKKVLNMTEVMFAFQMRGKSERQTVKDWNDHLETGRGAEIVKLLPTLETGEAHLSSPQFLGFEDVVRITPKHTFDSSSTPVGEFGEASTYDLTPIDLDQVREAMAATIEEARANDPKALQKRIRELESQISDPPDYAPNELALKQASQDGFDEGYAQGRGEIAKLYNEIVRAANEQMTLVGQALAEIRKITELYQEVPILTELGDIDVQVIDTAFLPKVPRSVRVEHDHIPVPTKQPLKKLTVTKTEAGRLPSGLQKIIDGLARLEAMGIKTPTRAVVGAVAGFSYKGGTFQKYVGQLNSQGLIEYPFDGEIALTDEGRRAAASADVPLRRSELHEMFLSMFDLGPRTLLRHLVVCYPESITRKALGDVTGYTASGGTFQKYIGKLKTFGAVIYPADGLVRASDLLFPRGLR